MNPNLQKLRFFAYLLIRTHKPIRQWEFDTQKDFEKAMRFLRSSDIDIQHERGHAEKARELGYDVSWGIDTYDLPIVGTVHRFYVKPLGFTLPELLKNPKILRDLQAISESVEEKSPSDAECSDLCGILREEMENDSN